MQTRFSPQMAGCILLFFSGCAIAQQTYRLKDLGTLESSGSSAIAINASGTVLGSSQDVNSNSLAFVWHGNTITELGTLGGSNTFARAINGLGQVTGSSAYSSSVATHAFFWDGASMLDLGDLGGGRSTGNAINNAGQITGVAVTTGNRSHAFLWDGAMMRDLGTLGGFESVGNAINATGQITGDAATAGGVTHAFLWDGTMMRDLGAPVGGSSSGVAINASGQVTGTTISNTGLTRAFLWDGTSMKDLGSLGGNSSQGEKINASGQVAGRSNITNGDRRPFLWTAGQMRDLGSLGGKDGSPSALNGLGQVVGSSQVTRTGTRSRGFVSDGGPMFDLNTLVDPKDPLEGRVTLRGASDINNLGWIVGNGFDKVTNELHGYLLTPIAYEIPFQSPAANSQWKLGQTVTIKLRLIDFDGAPITDTRATDLAAAPCRVTFTVTGAQSRSATCMQYNAATNQFFFNWPLTKSGLGSASIKAHVRYGSPSKVTTITSRNIKIVR